MTREQMIELADRLTAIAQNDYTIDGRYLDTGTTLLANAAALRQMAEQQPVGPGFTYVKCPWCGESWAAPVPAVDLAKWKREATRLASAYRTSHAAFAAHLEKL